MFVRMGRDWFVNADHIAEVGFFTRDGLTMARVQAWSLSDDGDDALLEYRVEAPDADLLRAQLEALLPAPWGRGHQGGR